MLQNFKNTFFVEQSRYKKGIGMTKTNILTLPEIIYLSKNVI